MTWPDWKSKFHLNAPTLSRHMSINPPRPKRLCFVSRNDLSGVPYYDLLLPCLSRHGWEIEVHAPGATHSVLRRTIGYEGAAFEIPSCKNRLKHELGVLRALLRARCGRFDVIYVCGQFLASRAAMTLAGPLFGKRLVYHNADFFDPVAHPWHCWLEGRLSRKSWLYINDEYHRGYITQSYYRLDCPVLIAPPNLPSTWPQPQRTAERRAELVGNGPDNSFVIMNCGPYTDLRMMPQLLQALTLLPENFRLAWTGAAFRKEEVDALLARLGLGPRVVRLPRLEYNEMLAYAAATDAGALLVANNDLGNFFGAEGRLTQYLLAGLPVLASEHTGLENMVIRYQLGLCTDAEHPEAIAHSLLELQRRRDGGGFTTERIRQTFHDHFAFDHWEPLVVDAFERLVTHGRERVSARPRYPWMPKP
jgi:glycosyltransferase involved in cell wall biosynthesis